MHDLPQPFSREAQFLAALCDFYCYIVNIPEDEAEEVIKSSYKSAKSNLYGAECKSALQELMHWFKENEVSEGIAKFDGFESKLGRVISNAAIQLLLNKKSYQQAEDDVLNELLPFVADGKIEYLKVAHILEKNLANIFATHPESLETEIDDKLQLEIIFLNLAYEITKSAGIEELKIFLESEIRISTHTPIFEEDYLNLSADDKELIAETLAYLGLADIQPLKAFNKFEIDFLDDVKFPDRRFGVEFEFAECDREKLLEVFVNAGLPVSQFCESMFVRGNEGWCIKTDTPNLEISSPVLQGKEGLAQVVAVANGLIEAGVEINLKCGFHVHVDRTGLSIEEIKETLVTTVIFDDITDQFLISERKGLKNGHCVSPLIEYWSRNKPVENAEDWNEVRANYARELSKMISDSGDYLDPVIERFDKNSKVTLHQLYETFEFRGKEGLLDPETIALWVCACIETVEKGKDGQFPMFLFRLQPQPENGYVKLSLKPEAGMSTPENFVG